MPAGDEIVSFGYWLRRRRKTLDLTQEALATQVGCAIATIKKIEADERRPSREMAARLADCLAIGEGERAAFLRASRAELSPQRLSDPLRPEMRASSSSEVAPSAAASAPQIHNLPITTDRLIGRSGEIAQLQVLLQRDAVRLVTLTGPGGIGKTRLACAVAHELARQSAATFYFVALAPISDATLVIPTIAQTLGIAARSDQSPLDSLKHHLRSRRTFLLLDNFEQVIDAAHQIGELLTSAAELQVFVTSRALLRLSGEHEFSVPPLRLPESTEQTDVAQLAQCESVQLLIARAQSSGADLTLTSDNAADIAAICLRLEGLPLALELAAARCRLFTPPALLARLNQRLRLLTAGARDRPLRQQTLRATIDWSYQLLRPTEQQLFAQLSLFVGGFTVEAVEAICQGAGDSVQETVDALSALLEQNLIQRVDSSKAERRFLMLETIQEYGRERLAAQGDEALLHQRHAAYYLALAEQAQLPLFNSQQQLWYQRLINEQGNFRAALERAQATNDAGYVAQLGGALHWFWWKHGDLRQEQKRLEWALAEIERQADQPSLTVRAKALFGVAMCAVSFDNLARGQKLYEEILALDPTYLAYIDRWIVLSTLSETYLWEGNFQREKALLEECLRLSREHSFTTGIAHSLSILGEIALFQGDPEGACDLLEEALPLRRAVGTFTGVASTLGQLSQAVRDLGDLPRATPLLDESQRLCETLDDKQGIVWVLFLRGVIAQLQLDYQQAKHLLRSALAVARDLNFQLEISTVLLKLGNLALLQGDVENACASYADALVTAQSYRYKVLLVAGIEGMAGVAALRGQPIRATEWLGAAKAEREALGLGRSADELQVYQQINRLVLDALDQRSFVAAIERGQRISLDQAVTKVLEFYRTGKVS